MIQPAIPIDLYMIFILLLLNFIYNFFSFSDKPEVQLNLTSGFEPRVQSNVTLGLEVNEGEDVVMICDIDANPPEDEITWYHKVRFYLFIIINFLNIVEE